MSDLIGNFDWKNSEKIKLNLIPDKVEGTLHNLLNEVLSVSISANHCFISLLCKSDSINLFSSSKMMCDQIN